MIILRTLLKLGLWFLASFIVIVAGLYLTLVAINWSDQPPSAEALRLAAAHESLPPVSDQDNGYVYALGFAAARDENPRQVGAERAAWIRRLGDDRDRVLHDPDPLNAPDSPAALWSESAVAVASVFDRACATARGSTDTQCLAALDSRLGEIVRWLDEDRWLLDRYHALIAHPDWRELGTYDHVTPWSLLGPPTAGQRLLFIQAWRRAVDGDAAGVRALLSDDVAFWRRALAQSGHLTAKRLITERLGDHFRWGAIVLKRLPPDLAADAIPPAWSTPLSAAELSILRPVVHEWLRAQRLIEIAAAGGDPYAGTQGLDVRPLSERLSVSLGRPLVQLQDFANKYAHAMLTAVDTLAVPVERYPVAVASVRAQQPPVTGQGFSDWTYNPVGNALIAMMDGVYGVLAHHAGLVADLEGMRRATLLASQMRAAGIEDGRGAALLAPPELYDPYTGEPFVWDASVEALVFQGLDPTTRGTHQIWY